MTVYIRRVMVFVLIAFYSSVSAQELICHSPHKGKTLNRQQVVTLMASAKKPLNLCGTHLNDVDLSDLNLAGINFDGADLSLVRLDKANLEGASLIKTYFRWASLKNTRLMAANMRQAIFQQADASQADFRQGQLQQANFTAAKLTAADFSGAELAEANFVNSQLTGARFVWSQLRSADFEGAIANQVDFNHSQLSQANMSQADLSSSQFRQANLTAVNFTQARLTNSDFYNANVQQVIYQPQLGYLPNLVYLATSQHFRTMRFDQQAGVAALAELRNAYSRIGVRDMQRTITAMLKVNDMHQSWQRGGWGRLESILSYLLFYLTCDFGLAPGRALQLCALLTLLLTLVYVVALATGTKRNGIFLQWQQEFGQKERLSTPTVAKKDIIVRLKPRPTVTWVLLALESWRLLRIAFYFSLLTTFHIGWRELNVSTWLSRLQKREYRLTARGWVRVIAGSQSLISAYLVVLWVFTYFGQPFMW